MAEDDLIITTRLLGDLGVVDFNSDATVTLRVLIQPDSTTHAKIVLTRKEAHILSRVVEHLKGER